MSLIIHLIKQEEQKENFYTITLDVHLTFIILHLLTFLFPDLKKKTQKSYHFWDHVNKQNWQG